MQPSRCTLRIHTRWRHFLYPLPMKARQYCWYKRDLAERNEAELRRPYYQIKPVDDIGIKEEQVIRSNSILDSATIDNLRRSTLVLSEIPGPLPEEGNSDSPENSHLESAINTTHHRHHAFYPAYGRTFECQPQHSIK